MCCQQSRSQTISGAYGCHCGCGSGRSFRRFISSKEEVEMLEDYREQLKKELAGMEERIQELKTK